MENNSNVFRIPDPSEEFWSNYRPAILTDIFKIGDYCYYYYYYYYYK